MIVNNLDDGYKFNATILSQIEGWREEAIKQFKANLISEYELACCMRWLNRLEDKCEGNEKYRITRVEKRLEQYWARRLQAKKYFWPLRKYPSGLGASHAK